MVPRRSREMATRREILLKEVSRGRNAEVSQSPWRKRLYDRSSGLGRNGASPGLLKRQQRRIQAASSRLRGMVALTLADSVDVPVDQRGEPRRILTAVEENAIAILAVSSGSTGFLVVPVERLGHLLQSAL